jgi:hypothetical protein
LIESKKVLLSPQNCEKKKKEQKKVVNCSCLLGSSSQTSLCMNAGTGLGKGEKGIF